MEATTVDDGSSSEFAFAASVDDNNSGTSNDKSTKIRLNSFPGEDALAHEGERWIESTTRRFADYGVLETAYKGDSPAVLEIIDYDLSFLPDLPDTHPQAARRNSMLYKKIWGYSLIKVT